MLPSCRSPHITVCMANTVEGKDDAADQQLLSVPEASAQGDSSASGGAVAQANVGGRQCHGDGRTCSKIVVMVKGLQFHSRH